MLKPVRRNILLIICSLYCLSAAQILFAQQPQLNVQVGHLDSVNKVVFSPDGKLFASASIDNTIKLWETDSGKQLRTLVIPDSYVMSVAFSPNGKTVAVSGIDSTVRIWDIVTGAELKVFKIANFTQSVLFSPDGRFLVYGEKSGTVRFLDIESGKEVKRFGNSLTSKQFDPLEYTYKDSIAFSPDGKILAASAKNEIKIWNVESGKELKTLSGHSAPVHSVAFSPDGKTLASGSWDKTIKIWNVETGGELKTLTGHTYFVETVAFSPDGEMLASGGSDKTVKLWNVKSGKEIKSITGFNYSVFSVAFSPDGKTLAAGSDDHTIYLWETASGKELHKFSASSFYISYAQFSPDGKTLANAMLNDEIKLWKLDNDKPPKTLKLTSGFTEKLAFSPDSRFLASGSFEGAITIWDADSGNLLKTLSGHSAPIHSIVFSPDGKTLASGSSDYTIRLWDVASGKELYKLTGHEYSIDALEFSTDGKMLASGETDDDIRIWDAASGKLLEALNKNLDTTKQKISTLFPGFYDFYDDTAASEKITAQRVEYTKTKLLDRQTKRELATIIAVGENDWLVITPEGFFDGTPAAWKQLLWRFNNNTFDYGAVELYFNDFYYPGLLQDVIAGKSPQPRAGQELEKIDRRQPKVEIVSINGKTENQAVSDKRTATVSIEISDNTDKKKFAGQSETSGAQDLRLFRNGTLVKIWRGGVFELGKKDNCKSSIPANSSAPRRVVCTAEVSIIAGENNFTAYAFNSSNVKSNDANAKITGAEILKRKGKLNILAVGINEYQNKKYNLNFAKPDAVDFGAELRKRQINLADYETPEVIQLTDAEATKQNFLYALERFAKGDAAKTSATISPSLKTKLAAIQKTQPEDALIIYFAGHGTAYQSRFYLIPTDGFPLNPQDEKTRINLLHIQSISDLELESVLRETDAGELMLIIDACNSGQALESEEKRRGPMNSKGLAQLAFEKGMYILTAAQSYQSALEVSRTPDGKSVEHGLLTYSLLQGMNAAQADTNADKKITEREWFGYAAENVPRMQLEEMQKRSAEIKNGDEKVKGRSELAVAAGDDKNTKPENRALQTPRIFYRRETSAAPFVVAGLSR